MTSSAGPGRATRCSPRSPPTRAGARAHARPASPRARAPCAPSARRETEAQPGGTKRITACAARLAAVGRPCGTLRAAGDAETDAGRSRARGSRGSASTAAPRAASGRGSRRPSRAPRRQRRWRCSSAGARPRRGRSRAGARRTRTRSPRRPRSAPAPSRCPRTADARDGSAPRAATTGARTVDGNTTPSRRAGRAGRTGTRSAPPAIGDAPRAGSRRRARRARRSGTTRSDARATRRALGHRELQRELVRQPLVVVVEQRHPRHRDASTPALRAPPTPWRRGSSTTRSRGSTTSASARRRRVGSVDDDHHLDLVQRLRQHTAPRATSDGRSAVGTTTDTSGSAGTLTTARRYRFAPRPDSRGAVRSSLRSRGRRALTPWQPRTAPGAPRGSRRDSVSTIFRPREDDRGWRADSLPGVGRARDRGHRRGILRTRLRVRRSRRRRSSTSSWSSARTRASTPCSGRTIRPRASRCGTCARAASSTRTACRSVLREGGAAAGRSPDALRDQPGEDRRVRDAAAAEHDLRRAAAGASARGSPSLSRIPACPRRTRACCSSAAPVNHRHAPTAATRRTCRTARTRSPVRIRP